MNLQHIPGVVLVVLKDGKVVKQQAYRLANLEVGVPTSLDSVFPLASVTKVFTSTAVYLLVQEQKIHLEDKVPQLLPGLPNAWNEITVLNCLTHTSGLADIFPGSPAAAPADWIAGAAQEEALKKVAARPLLYEPGEKSIYTDRVLVNEDDCRKSVRPRPGGVSEETHLRAPRYGICSFRRLYRHCSEARGAVHELHS